MSKLTYLVFSLSLLLFISCSNNPKEKKQPQETNSENLEVSKSNEKFGRTNYAVVTKWATTDVNLVSEKSPIISKELNDLWEKDIVENAYYDSEATEDKFAHFPNIFFFLKAKSDDEAESILNNLTIVKEGIITYELYPVGLLWYGRDSEIINKKGITKSFAAVWNTNDKSKITDDLLLEQSKQINELWNNGELENVYLDIEEYNNSTRKTDFVFFVNANTIEEAEKICKSITFYKNEIASYELYQVGVFWMGKSKEN